MEKIEVLVYSNFNGIVEFINRDFAGYPNKKIDIIGNIVIAYIWNCGSEFEYTVRNVIKKGVKEKMNEQTNWYRIHNKKLAHLVD